jgi:hypothetical protein
MAFTLGGTWGIAILILLVLAPVADWVGMRPVLRLTPAGYMLSGLFAFYVLRQQTHAVNGHPGFSRH